jgi:hypothetical protein
MPTSEQIYENRLLTLDRLVCGHDRIIWQQRDGECIPEAVWWERPPQIGRPKPWLLTCTWLKARGLITEGLRPKSSVYRDYKHVAVFVATPQAQDAFINLVA